MVQFLLCCTGQWVRPSMLCKIILTRRLRTWSLILLELIMRLPASLKKLRMIYVIVLSCMIKALQFLTNTTLKKRSIIFLVKGWRQRWCDRVQAGDGRCQWRDGEGGSRNNVRFSKLYLELCDKS